MPYSPPPTSGSMTLTANFDTTNLTATDSNLSLPVVAGDVIDIMVTGTVIKSAGSAGLKVAIGAPTGATVKGWRFAGINALNTMQNDFITAINTLGAAFCTAIATELTFVIQVSVVNPTNAGNIVIQLASVTSNTATIVAGTKMTWDKSRQV